MFNNIKTAEQLATEKAQAEIEAANAQARDYLAKTDWYVIRQQEQGTLIPDDILTARQVARDSIV